MITKIHKHAAFRISEEDNTTTINKDIDLLYRALMNDCKDCLMTDIKPTDVIRLDIILLSESEPGVVK